MCTAIAEVKSTNLLIRKDCRYNEGISDLGCRNVGLLVEARADSAKEIVVPRADSTEEIVVPRVDSAEEIVEARADSAKEIVEVRADSVEE